MKAKENNLSKNNYKKWNGWQPMIRKIKNTIQRN